MTNDRSSAPPRSADVLPDIIRVLGDVLKVDPQKIDPEQTFQFLGLGSLLIAEFVAVVNARYGTALCPSDLYDHPTPAAFAREVVRAAEPVALQVVPAVPLAPTVTPVTPVVPVVPVTPVVPAPRNPVVPGTEIVDVLREQLTAILCCDSWDVDADTPFPRLGVDSLLGAEFVSVVNRVFGLSERAVVLHEYQTLDALAAYVGRQTGVRTAPPAVRELELLLDALQDGRLSVAEALLLLPRRAQV
ncbi:phosphopantetheine-binding protein [Streptomyces sp. NPDC059533]|uniref:phosphopantetheine-binding protein n=1 Tax=unclassified Streptomyces TaxID=2593676 RepID=UPI00369B3A6F